ncbi:hypothetical protein BB559_003627 [Furculomyces boomerangus]|uniref:Inhibitor I9 domain-containing protein n=1 Tax=Furculomyces boomerangus TaxID=61424 RepID=A0A2T9YK47_9FUNG|nr:hypothetical protein BB559_003627 [Furculomyces boomerangus]
MKIGFIAFVNVAALSSVFATADAESNENPNALFYRTHYRHHKNLYKACIRDHGGAKEMDQNSATKKYLTEGVSVEITAKFTSKEEERLVNATPEES